MRARFQALGTMLTAAFLVGCSSARFSVAQYGAMREVLREGRTEARVELAEIVGHPHAVAVGAVEGLAGEITIVDGEVWVARVADDGLHVSGPDLIRGDRATLLTAAHVSAWRSITIEAPAEGHDLESLIEQAARTHGNDTEEPFPFTIEGELTALDLHVINGYCPIATDPAAVGAEPWRWSSTGSVHGRVVGFFASDAAGVMTHHGTAVHAHAILSIDGRTITGHVDRLAVGPGATLRVPARN